MSDFLVEKFKLEKPQVFELIFSIGLCYDLNVKVPEALQRIRRYLTSLMFMDHSLHYAPSMKLVSFNPTTKVATFQDGSKVEVSEKVIISPTQAPKDSKHVPQQQYQVHRLTCIVENPCTEWFNEGESAAMVVFPPGSLKSGNKEVVQAFILGAGSEICPEGTIVWYLSTTEQGPRAEMDIDAALEAMEMALLRESSSGLENDEEIVQLTGNSHTIVNSVKLGQSFGVCS
ncbi:BAF_collapsed_G0053860.mRNA.1.CDS.1 [Saccharomyces cerevisiae]|nr:BAF_collapsed_G0053860.mRNA.1.CDS.1 [Saccharomyces cerevisiae]